MRFARALLLAVTALLGIAACADAKAAASVRVTVAPGSVAPGGQVNVQGSCGDGSATATVASPAFGSVTVTPSAGQLVATVTVAPSTPAGTYDIRLTCASGAQATTRLTVVAPTASAAPTVPGPDTGGGFLAGRGANDPGQSEDGRGGLSLWLALAAGCLLAAAAVAVRERKRPGPPVRPGRGRTGGPRPYGRARRNRTSGGRPLAG